MKKFKRIFALFFCFLIAAGVLSGCGKAVSSSEVGTSTTETEKPLKVVTTIFPEYDWVRQILGERAGNVELTMLLDNGVDLHSYQPTADDIIKISDCDLFVYVGGESDGWVEDALKEATNKNMKVINLLDVLKDTVKTEEAVPGMQAEEGHNHGVADFADSDVKDRDLSDWNGEWQSAYPYILDGTLDPVMEKKAESGTKTAEEYKDSSAMTGAEIADEMLEHEEKEYDEHVWLSAKNAGTICNAIAAALEEIDPANKEIYAANAKSYQEKLSALDAEYQSAVDNAARKTVLFGDRFPFRYLVDDYGLSYYAAFAGCSAESEASFETISFLAHKVDELNLPCVLTIEGAKHKIAETIVQNTVEKNQKILTLDSMQSTTTTDVENGTTYLSVMEDNLDILKQALN